MNCPKSSAGPGEGIHTIISEGITQMIENQRQDKLSQRRSWNDGLFFFFSCSLMQPVLDRNGDYPNPAGIAIMNWERKEGSQWHSRQALASMWENIWRESKVQCDPEMKRHQGSGANQGRQHWLGMEKLGSLGQSDRGQEAEGEKLHANIWGAMWRKRKE